MKHKEIQIGRDYILASSKRSNPAMALKYFKALIGKKVTAIDKYSDIKNKNVIRIEGVVGNSIVEMWCSPYDLQNIGETK